MARYKAAVIGGSGYGANEIIRRLLVHPDVELIRVASIDYVDQPLGAPHPNLEGLSNLRLENIEPEEAARGADVVLLGLPHTVSARYVQRLVAAGVPKIVDLSGDFRLKDIAAYERYYGAKHPCPELCAGAVYGLPELYRDRIREASLVASPGCFATGTALGLMPLARAGLLSGEVRTVAITGSSGSGAAPKDTTHHPVRAQNLRTYKPLDHQHVPEIEQTLREAGAGDITLSMVPVSAPLTRGIFATSFVTLAKSMRTQVTDAFESAFEEERFVRMPRGRLPEVVAVSGSNYAEIGFACDTVGDHLTVACFSAIDNLIKGGAGQAIQSMNIMLGLQEDATLRDPGGYP